MLGIFSIAIVISNYNTCLINGLALPIEELVAFECNRAVKYTATLVVTI